MMPLRPRASQAAQIVPRAPWNSAGPQFIVRFAMRYNRDFHHRRSIRLTSWNYRERGAYFVTICTYERECTLVDASLAVIVLETWNAMPNHFANTTVDEFIVMPNHVHGIISITQAPTVGARHDAPQRPVIVRRPVLEPGSLGAIVLQFKSAAARRINLARNTPGARVWQRNYYERVIRDERELARARQYILENPAKWAVDKHNPVNIRTTDVVQDRGVGAHHDAPLR